MNLTAVDLPEFSPSRKIYKQHPEGSAKRAHSMVTISLRRHPENRMACCICGCVKVAAHHEDYNLPLRVVFLCQSHHIQRHHELGWGQAKRVVERVFVPEIAGDIQIHLEQALRCFDGGSTKMASDIATELSIKRSNASNRLSRLLGLKLLKRERNGKFWNYSRP